MRWMIGVLLMAFVGLSLGLAAPAASEAKCLPDSVLVGTTCIDKYEASVWETTDAKLIKKIRGGSVTLAELTAAGAVQHGVSSDDYGTGCPDTGNGCVDFYAVSIGGVTPSRFITWFQAAAAARNSDKRLPTNAEWQAAALGTPDTGGADDGVTTCNSDNLAPGVTATGSRSACVSDVGAFDMVGNLVEWVADWVPLTPISVTPLFAGDQNVTGVVVVNDGPAALLRGGQFTDFTTAGVFAVYGSNRPSASGALIGFRAAR